MKPDHFKSAAATGILDLRRSKLLRAQDIDKARPGVLLIEEAMNLMASGGWSYVYQKQSDGTWAKPV